MNKYYLKVGDSYISGFDSNGLFQFCSFSMRKSYPLHICRKLIKNHHIAMRSKTYFIYKILIEKEINEG